MYSDPLDVFVHRAFPATTTKKKPANGKQEWRAPKKYGRERGGKGNLWMHVTQFWMLSHVDGRGSRSFSVTGCNLTALWLLELKVSARFYWL